MKTVVAAGGIEAPREYWKLSPGQVSSEVAEAVRVAAEAEHLVNVETRLELAAWKEFHVRERALQEAHEAALAELNAQKRTAVGPIAARKQEALDATKGLHEAVALSITPLHPSASWGEARKGGHTYQTLTCDGCGAELYRWTAKDWENEVSFTYAEERGLRDAADTARKAGADSKGVYDAREAAAKELMEEKKRTKLASYVENHAWQVARMLVHEAAAGLMI